MKFFSKQASFGLPTTVTKMGEDQKGPKAYVVEQAKYKSLLSGAICMVVAFGFLYLAFNSERASFNARSEQIFQVEEHQRMEKQTAELKLLQITQMLTAHLDSEIEEESEMKQLYVNMIDTQTQGTDRIDQLLDGKLEGADRKAVMDEFEQIMFNVNAIVGNHERESRKRGDHARALLKTIHRNVIQELEHEIADDVNDQFIEYAAHSRHLQLSESDMQQSTHAHAAFDSMLGQLQAKVDAMTADDDFTASDSPSSLSAHRAQLSTWYGLITSMEERVVSREQMAEIVTMIEALPHSIRHTTAATTILEIARHGATNAGGNAGGNAHETRLASLSKHANTILGELQGYSNKANLDRALADWKNGTHTPHQTFLRVQMMTRNGQLPSRWLAEAVESQQDWQQQQQQDVHVQHRRAATPPPVPAQQQQQQAADINSVHAAL